MTELNSIGFVELPALVLETILEYLNPPSLKKLRSVSKTLNTLVTTSKHFGKLKFHINSQERMEALLKTCSLPLRNVVIIGPYVCTCAAVTAFLYKFRFANLNSLALCRERSCPTVVLDPNEFANILLKLSPSLKSLQIGARLGDGLKPMSQPALDLLEQFFKGNAKTLKQSLGGLRRLILRSTICSDVVAVQMVTIELLKVCPKLQDIEVPNVFMQDYPNPDDGGLGNGEYRRQFLLSYLRQSSSVHQATQFTFSLTTHTSAYNVDFYIWAQKLVSVFPITTQTLIQIAALRGPERVRLFNVPSQILPNSDSLSDKMKLNLDQCIGSIVCCGHEDSRNPIPTNKYVPTASKLRQIVFPIYGNPAVHSCAGLRLVELN